MASIETSSNSRLSGKRAAPWSSALGKRIVVFALALSCVFAIVATAVQLAIRYNADKVETLGTFDSTEAGFAQSLEDAVSRFDKARIDLLLNGISSHRDIAFVALTTADGTFFTRGIEADVERSRTYELSRSEDGEDIRIGALTIGIDFTTARTRLKGRIWTTLVANLFKTLAVGLILLILFDKLVGRHLRRLSSVLQTSPWTNPENKIRLQRRPRDVPDELDKIVMSFETMRNQTQTAFKAISEQAKNLSELNRSLAAANREQADLTYALSHDIVTPVNTIDQLLHELEEDSPDPDTQDLLEDMRVTVKRMRHQIGSVQAYAAVLSHAHRPDYIDLDEVMETAVQMLARELSEGCEDIILEPLGPAYADKNAVTSLVVQLLTNALQYRDSDRALKITIAPEEAPQEDMIAFSVSDTGRGIAKEHHNQVFELFRRLHAQGDIPGCGVGLTLCRRIITRQNGKISLISTLGVGSKFTVVLPQKG